MFPWKQEFGLEIFCFSVTGFSQLSVAVCRLYQDALAVW